MRFTIDQPDLVVAPGLVVERYNRTLRYDWLKEPLNNPAWSAFQSEKPQIVWCQPSDSSHRYGRGWQRARCGFSGETHTGRAFAGAPPRLGSLIWNNQTGLSQAEPEHPAKAPSRPRRVVQRFLNKFLAESIHRAAAPALPCLRFGRSINYQLIPVRLGICCKLLQPLSVNTELIFAGFPEYWLKDRCPCG